MNFSPNLFANPRPISPLVYATYITTNWNIRFNLGSGETYRLSGQISFFERGTNSSLDDEYPFFSLFFSSKNPRPLQWIETRSEKFSRVKPSRRGEKKSRSFVSPRKRLINEWKIIDRLESKRGTHRYKWITSPRNFLPLGRERTFGVISARDYTSSVRSSSQEL